MARDSDSFPVDVVAARAVRQAWGALAPSGAAVAVWGVDVDADVGAGLMRDDDTLHVERAVEKRQVEFLRGRACARAALQMLGGPAAAPLPVGAARGPIWPDGFTGSITHTAGIVGAIVAPLSACAGIGIDVERGSALPEGTGRLVLQPEEQDRLVSPLDLVAFSAKESIFKAVHPVVERWIGFKEARIDFAAAESFAVEWTTDAPPVPAARLEGRYRAGPNWVTALLWIDRDSPA